MQLLKVAFKGYNGISNQAAKHLIQELHTGFSKGKRGYYDFCTTTWTRGLQQGREDERKAVEKGRHEDILAVARRLLVEEGLSSQAVQYSTPHCPDHFSPKKPQFGVS